MKTSLLAIAAFMFATAAVGDSFSPSPVGTSTNGQPLYNSSGQVGGYTLGGDCTLVASTGIVTCLKTNGTSFTSLATTSPGSNVPTALGYAANATGGFGTVGTSGTNVGLLNANNTHSGTETLQGSSSAPAAVLTNALEPATVSATAATGTINFYFATQSVLYYTSNASANWTMNFALSSGTSLGSQMSVGQVVTGVFAVTNGSTAYYNSAIDVDGTATGVTTYWQGGSAPSAGDASTVDIYTYSIIKTASTPTYTVFASLTKF